MSLSMVMRKQNFSTSWADERQVFVRSEPSRSTYLATSSASGEEQEQLVESECLLSLASDYSVAVIDVTDDHSVFRDKTVFICDLGDSRLFLERPLPVVIEYVGDQVNAFSSDVEDFATGGNDFEAVAELKSSIVELYFLLKSEQPNLGPLPARQWRFLSSIIGEPEPWR